MSTLTKTCSIIGALAVAASATTATADAAAPHHHAPSAAQRAAVKVSPGSHGGLNAPVVTAAAPKSVRTSTTTSSSSGLVRSKTATAPIGVQGIDISSHTVVNDWAGWSAAGVKFIWAKASEGTYYANPKFAAQSTGAKAAGMVFGAYHFATPDSSSGEAQADYAIAHGGGWKRNSGSLPLALDMEWNPYGNSCYNMTPRQLGSWISHFENEYQDATGTYAPIYTATAWWNTCVGGSYTNPNTPLWLAKYSSSVGAMPTPWVNSSQMVWQNAAIDSKGYDTDVFNGTLGSLTRYANTGIWPN